MNASMLERVVEALIYEGYVLYPYRRSVKNRQRWTFGAILTKGYSDLHPGNESHVAQTEVLLRGNKSSTLQVSVRFLHLLDRVVHTLEPAGQANDINRTERWQEAVERSYAAPPCTLESLLTTPWCGNFTFPGSTSREPNTDSEQTSAVVGRQQHRIAGKLELSATLVATESFKVRVRVENVTVAQHADRQTRDDAVLQALASCHVVLEVAGGAFVSLIDPSQELRAAVRSCQNVGLWPVLVGNPGDADTMLAAPIILYDYPQVAAESPGNLYDGTEIDEMLTLRIQTLTAEEKSQAIELDERIRALLQRTDALTDAQLHGLHGNMLGPRVRSGDGT